MIQVIHLFVRVTGQGSLKLYHRVIINDCEGSLLVEGKRQLPETLSLPVPSSYSPGSTTHQHYERFHNMHGTVSLCNQLRNSEPGSELTADSLDCSGLSPSSPSTLAHLKTFDIGTSLFNPIWTGVWESIPVPVWGAKMPPLWFLCMGTLIQLKI